MRQRETSRSKAVFVRCIGFIGIFVVLFAVSANAADAEKPCLGMSGEKRNAEAPVTQTEQVLLTDNECEAVKRKGLQLRLIEIPQQEEDPMGLSLGSKDKGGMLYFKIPFSF
jgi:hypothetical protein